MQDHGSTDPAALVMGALADEIAARLAIRLVPQLVEIVQAGGSHRPASRAQLGNESTREAEEPIAADHGLWTAGRVAAHYDVAVRFVYRHAEALGCVRLGGGARPRLRFDPEIVRQRWPHVGDALPASASNRRPSSRRPAQRRRSGRPSFELLDFDREP